MHAMAHEVIVPKFNRISLSLSIFSTAFKTFKYIKVGMVMGEKYFCSRESSY